MRKVALALLVFFGIGIAMNAVAADVYTGFSLDTVRSSGNGANNSSAGFTGLISARPNEYYGYEVQGGIFGKAGPFSMNAEDDFSVAGFLPLGNSGINLYGKAGVDAIYSSGNVFNTGFTYGAGVEYRRGNGKGRKRGRYPLFPIFYFSWPTLWAIRQLASHQLPQLLNKARIATGQTFLYILPQCLDFLRFISFAQPGRPVVDCCKLLAPVGFEIQQAV